MYARFIDDCLQADADSKIKVDAVIESFEKWRSDNSVDGKFGRNTVMHNVEKRLFGAELDNLSRRTKFPDQKGLQAGYSGWRLAANEDEATVNRFEYS